MKAFFILLALVGLTFAGPPGLWEIIPLTDEAQNSFDPNTFNISTCDKALYNVTRLPDSPDMYNYPDYLALANLNNLDLTSETWEECDRTGSPITHDNWCVPSWEHDESQCNVAYYVPVTPVPDYCPECKTSIDAWIYDYDCKRVRGCKLNVPKEGRWWSVTSDLRWTLESKDWYNFPPHFKYVDVDCNYPECKRWTWLYWNMSEGIEIYLFRHGFTCNQP